MGLYLGETKIAGGTQSGNRNIGEIVTSTIPLTDAGLHLLDGALIQDSGSYSAFVDYIVDLVTDYPDLFCTEADWQTSVATYGVCGKFVYTEKKPILYAWTDYVSVHEPTYYLKHNQLALVGENVYDYDGTVIGTVAENGSDATGSYFTTYVGGIKFYKNLARNLDAVSATVRLPKVTGIIEGTTDLSALGDLIEAGLPNITGTIDTMVPYSRTSTSGVFTDTNNGQSYACATSTNNGVIVTLDASRSSSIYGNSTTVQPQTIKVLYYIVIATTMKTAVQVDIDDIATDLNGKLDTDGSNTSSKLSDSFISRFAPDYAHGTTVAATDDTEQTFTAPSAGWFNFNLWSQGATLPYVKVNDVYAIYGDYAASSSTAYEQMTGSIFVSKGDVIKFKTSKANSFWGNNNYFFPAKGAN